MKWSLLPLLLLLMITNALNAQHRCGTHSPKPQAKAELRQAMQSAHALASKTTAITNVPVTFHRVTQNDGTGGEDIAHINEILASVNHFYINADMKFYIAAIEDIQSTTLYETDYGNSQTGEDDLAEASEADNSFNIYLVNDFGGNTVGYAYFPFNSLQSTRSLILNGANSETYTHELGHWFGLYHTHEGTENGPNDQNAENVARTGNQANCDTNGDGLCDTEADPQDWDNFSFWQCLYTGNGTDEHGVVYDPPVHNIMSYYSGCETEFTDGQYEMMKDGLVVRQGHWRYTLDAPQTTVNPPTIFSAEIQGNEVVIDFQDQANNETGYILERSTDANGPFIAVYEAGIGPDETQFIDQPEDPAGNAYFYRVVPSNCVDCASNVVQVGEDVPKPPTVSISTNGWECPISAVVTGEDQDSPFTLYYTLNGETPDQNSAVVENGAAITLQEGDVLSVIGIDDSGLSSAIETASCQVPGQGVTVFFKRPEGNGQTPQIHYWNAVPNSGESSWPGEAMTDATNVYGPDWYSYTIEGADTTNLLFHYNNGQGGSGYKTDDLTEVTGGCYDMNEQAWVSCPIWPLQQYCTPTFEYWYAEDWALKEVAIGDDPAFVNNSEGNADQTQLGEGQYNISTDFRGLTDTIQFTIGTPTSFKATISNLNNIGVWIDLNANGEFEQEELLFTGSASNDEVLGQITVEDQTAVGIRTLRVLATDSQIGGACDDDYSSGETEDYYVKISEPAIITSVAASSAELRIWPQPDNNELNIYTSSHLGTAHVVDGLGRVHQSIVLKTGDNQLVLNGIAPGLYFLTTSEGIATRFVVK